MYGVVNVSGMYVNYVSIWEPDFFFFVYGFVDLIHFVSTFFFFFSVFGVLVLFSVCFCLCVVFLFSDFKFAIHYFAVP